MSSRPIEILVINLDRSTARRTFQEAQSARLGLAFTRFPAIDGASLDEESFRRYAYLWERPLSRSETGALLSHLACWRRIARGAGNALVLEDDAVLSPDVPRFLEEAASVDGPTAVNLEAKYNARYLSATETERARFDGFRVFDLLIGTHGAGAYLLTPEAAKRLVAHAEEKGGLADVALWTFAGIRRLQLDPGLAAPIEALEHRGDAAAETTITRPELGRRQSLTGFISHPRQRLRRLRGQLRLGYDKLRTRRSGSRRVVEPAPSVLAAYHAMKGL